MSAAALASALGEAEARDRADPALPLRDAFALPPGLVYLDGNSLGPLPLAARARMAEVLDGEWGSRLIRSWNDAGWWQRPVTLGDRLGALLGAAPGQMVVCDSISVNLFKLLVAALRLRPGRRVIVTQGENFPTDCYVAQGVAELLGDVALRYWDGVAPLATVLGPEVAAVLLTHVDYRTAACLDAAAVTAQVQRSGALMLWDLAHSAGAVPVALDAWGADFAVGCTYKYVSAGPGAPAFLYAAARHLGPAQQPITGWNGHARPFAFDRDYAPDAGIRRFLAGTPPLLAYAPLEAALSLLEAVPEAARVVKSRALSEAFLALADRFLPELALRSPRAPPERGSHLAFAHPNGYGLVQAAIARGVIGDFRAPDLIRLGFNPLFNTFADTVRAAGAFRAALDAPACLPKAVAGGLVT